jgi:hypothetical protein
MIYTVVGTDQHKREKAFAKLAKLGAPSVHLYAENVAEMEPLIQATSLFGDPIVALLIQTLEKAEDREVVYELLSDMETSATLFIFDEPFADTNRLKKLEKYSKEVLDAREEKSEGVNPFALCNAFAKRDKKTVWVEWMHIRDLESAEAIQGALWWKMKTIWEDSLSSRPSKFTKDECEVFGSRILRASILAHRGERDLKEELEGIILSV